MWEDGLWHLNDSQIKLVNSLRGVNDPNHQVLKLMHSGLLLHIIHEYGYDIWGIETFTSIPICADTDLLVNTLECII